MAFTEFFCRSGGSNVNAGTLDGGSAETGVNPLVAYTGGSWVQSTRTFTPASGNPVSAGVQVGHYASVYSDGATVPSAIARIASVTSTTIVLHSTAAMGTIPADGSGMSLRVGGAWRGPNGSVGFPITFFNSSTALRNLNSDTIRVNFKNDQTHDMTSAAIVHTNYAGPMVWEGYASSPGDGGMTTIQGPATGTGFVLATWSLNGQILRNMDFNRNGATTSGTGSGVTAGAGTNGSIIERCRFRNMTGNGSRLAGAIYRECEWTGCTAGGADSIGGATLERCRAHHNGTFGFGVTGGSFFDCIADFNGSFGFGGLNNSAIGPVLTRCDAYRNGGSGLQVNLSTPMAISIQDSNFVQNGGYGVNLTGSLRCGTIRNCGFGSGTRANSSGQTNGLSGVELVDPISYPADVSPYVDGDNGDFRLALPQARGVGRGAFLGLSAASWRDIGAMSSRPAGAIVWG